MASSIAAASSVPPQYTGPGPVARSLNLATLIPKPRHPKRKELHAEEEAAAAASLAKVTKPYQTQSWDANPSFWLKRSVFAQDVPEELRKAPKVESRPLTEAEALALEEIDQALDENTLPSAIEVRVCQTINALGLFAAKDVQKDELIGLYASEIMLDIPRGSRYRYKYTKELTMDARDKGNYTRFFNSVHPKDEPNVTTCLVKVDGRVERALIANVTIKKGQQYLLNYGEKYFNGFRIDPIRLTPDSQ